MVVNHNGDTVKVLFLQLDDKCDVADTLFDFTIAIKLLQSLSVIICHIIDSTGHMLLCSIYDGADRHTATQKVHIHEHQHMPLTHPLINILTKHHMFTPPPHSYTYNMLSCTSPTKVHPRMLDLVACESAIFF